jgi:ABC-type phosphate transport system substrate-binding protein
MRKLISLLLCITLLGGTAVMAAGPENELWSRTEPGGDFITFRLHHPDSDQLTWAQTMQLTVAYADTDEPVALSSGLKWSEWLFATVPAEDADRPLKVVMGEPARFEDCIKVWDGHEYDEAPSGTDQLNLRGIFVGDETGNLNPESVITRAEAFTVICRLLSLAPAGNPCFSDVTADAWYYDTASAAKAAGITNEPEQFRPNDPVTRGEFTVMLHRAMQTVGWLDGEEDSDAALSDVLVDAGSVPEWAREAYLAFAFRDLGIRTYRDTEEFDEFGAPVQEALAEHDKGATRGEVIEFIYHTMRFLPVYPSEAAIAYRFDEAMPVIDGSTSTKPYTNTVYGALFDNYTGHPQYPEEHSKSHQSYERLINGEADILFAATKPSRDIVAQAKAAGVELETIPIAYDAMVFFTNRANTLEGLTTEQIKSIYVDNAYDNWSELGGPDAELIPYCRNKDSGSQSLMEQFFLDAQDIHPDIRRETTSRSMESVLTDVQDALVVDPPAYALGYSIYYYYEGARRILLYPEDSLKLLAIDGVYPTDETIADGSYPLSGYNYAVIRADAPEDSAARRMVDFMLSPAGQLCVMNAGYGPLLSDLSQ